MAGTYNITTRDSNGCTATKVIDITEVNNTVANFSYNAPLPFAPTSVTFNNQSQNASEYQWFVDGVFATNQTNLTQLLEQAGNYPITLVASNVNKQCTDTLTKVITLTQQSNLFIPSAWGVENSLNLYSYGYQSVTFSLLNSLGQVVYKNTQTISNGSNTLIGATALARGIYYYQAEAKDQNGSITLIGGKLVRM